MIALAALTFAVLVMIPLLCGVRAPVCWSVDAAALVLAWLYVALRAAHSFVHLTYNNVHHRLAAYAASTVVLVVLWVKFALALT